MAYQNANQSSTSSYPMDPKRENDLLYGRPAYEDIGYTPWYKQKRNWIIGAVAAIVVIVAVVVGAVLGVRANAYPNYSKLNYSIKDTYSGTSFFDNFDYYTGYDPTSGFVHYVDSAGSASLNLTYATSTSATLRVDTSDQDATTGRKSVRVTSKNTYNSGLFVFDILHSPYGCATWSAVWLSDPNNWPTHGEIDVIESVNQGTSGNQVTLHTTKNCKMDRKRKQTGTVLGKNCYNGTDSNDGCGVEGKPVTYGEALNNVGGGVYAMEWRDAGIRTWFWERANIPANVNSSSPDPSSWGKPLADFPSTDCDISSHFKNASIIANIDLCGSWAGATGVYSDQDQCPGTCTNYVAQNATAFDTAYWEFGSFKVYTAS